MTCCKYSTPSWQSIMRKVTWRRFNLSAKQLVVGQTTISTEGRHNFHVPRPTVCHVLSYGQLQESWIISGLQWQTWMSIVCHLRMHTVLITVRGYLYVLTREKVLSWEYRSLRKRNSRPSSTPTILNAHSPNTLFYNKKFITAFLSLGLGNTS